jgi:hypothetical protein
VHLLGGAGFALLLKEGRFWGRLAAAALCSWLLITATGIYPDDLSYFNEAACLLKQPSRVGLDGGTACGPLWLDDSNVDWGQGLKQLKVWLDRHAPGVTIRLAYFGSLRPDLYGLSYIPVGPDDLLKPRPPGLYVISAHFVARGIGNLARQEGEGPGNWLLHTPPTAIVGHAYYIYDTRPSGAS